MLILAFNGSPRKGGNTDLLLDKMLEGAQSKGYETQKIYLYRKKISPCVDCRQCKLENFICPVKDDMPKIITDMEKADVILFGTPIYWYGPTAQMKLLIDRLRPFIENKKLKGKHGALVVVSEEGPSICEPLVKMFEMSFQYVGMKFHGVFLAKAYEKGEIAKNPKEMQRAFDFGKEL